MALENFYNLKEKKKDTILKAISKCLMVHNYDELSINDIATSAEISRGSFYNYFVDKNDAVLTLMVSKLYLLEDIFKKTVIEYNGRLFEGALKTYDLIKDVCANEYYIVIIRNLTYFKDLSTKILYSEKYSEELEKLLDWLMENTEEGKSYINTKKKMANVMEMIMMLFSATTIRMVTDSEISRKYDDFKYKLKVIEEGSKNI